MRPFHHAILCASLAAACLGLPGCGDDCDTDSTADLQAGETALVRGRVRGVDGLPVGRVTVRAAGQSARTDREGYFELETPLGPRQQVRVDSEDYAGGVAVVAATRGRTTSLELAVVPRRRQTLQDVEKGGRILDTDDLRLELPEKSLRRPDGTPAEGEAEVRWALVRSASAARAAPSLVRDEDGAQVRLSPRAMLEVGFYQDGERLTLEEPVEVTVSGPGMTDDDEPREAHHYDLDQSRWERRGDARADDGRWRMAADRDGWWIAADEAEDVTCVQAALRTPDGDPAEDTQVTAVGVDSLWVSRAVTDGRGRFCVEAPPGEDISLLAFWESETARGDWLRETATPDGAAMCGGDDCLDLGRQDLEGGPIPGLDLDGGSGGDGGDTGGGDLDAGVREPPPLLDEIRETFSTSEPGETLTLRFTAMGGERLAYTAESTATTPVDVVLRDPRGDTVADGRLVVSPVNFRDAFRLPEIAGEYTLEITPRDEGEGTLTLHLFGVPEDVETVIEVDGDVVEVSLDSVGQNALLRLQTDGSERLAYVVENEGTTTVDLELLDPRGMRVSDSQDVASAGSETFADQFVLPDIAGTYEFRVDPRQQGTGTLRMRLLSVPEDAEHALPIDAGEVTMRLTGVAQNGVFHFDADGGERIAYTVESNVQTPVDFRLYDPSGTRLSTSVTSAATGDTQTSFTDAQRLPEASGRYELQVDPRGQGVGQVTVDLFLVPDDDTPPVQDLEDYADSVSQTVTFGTPGQNAALRYDVAGADERVALLVTNRVDAPLDLEILGPDGERVSASNSVASANSEAFVVLSLAEPGEHTLRVDPRTRATGDAEVRLYRVNPESVGGAITLDGADGAATLTVPGQRAVFRFELTAGTLFTYTVEAADGGATTDVELLGPMGQDLTDVNTVSNGSTRTSEPVEAPSTGTYTLALDPRQERLNGYVVRIESP